MSEPCFILKEYLKYHNENIQKYGENTVILMQVGSFYEIYSVQNETLNLGADIYQLADILGIQVVRRNKSIPEITIENLSYREEKINSLISQLELDPVRDIKADILSGGQKKKLVIALSLISDPKILLLDEPFAALDVMTIKTLQEIIVDLQRSNNISIILCDHQARDLLACVDSAAIIHNGKVVAQDTPTNLIQNIEAKKAYFGESFNIS